MAVSRVDLTKQAVLRGVEDVTHAAATLRPGASVVIMIHGYRYAPGRAGACPHDSIYAENTAHAGAVSWPRALGLDGGDIRAGLAIGFGWPACGSLPGAYRRAAQAGVALAMLLRTLKETAPQARITVIGHSLGGRVALAALSHLDAGCVDTVILLVAAEFKTIAATAADSPAGRAAQIINVTSRENAFFDFGVRLLLGGGLAGTLGRGLQGQRPNWTDLQIDRSSTLSALESLGHMIAPARWRICHWSSYTRPGVFVLYRALIDGTLCAQHLRAALPCQTSQDHGQSRRGTRRLAMLWGTRALPLHRNASS